MGLSGQGPYLRTEERAHIWILTLDRPPVNALSLAVLEEIEAAMAAAAAAADLRAVIITAAGNRFFAAGADIGDLPSLDSTGGRALNAKFQRAFNAVAACPCPVICALNGMALGGGLELALACDIRISSENAQFGLPEAALGLIPGGGGTQRLPRLIAAGKAKALMFSGDRMEATEALRVGLVDQVTPAAEVLPTALQLAERIATRSPAAVRAIKAAVDGGLDRTLAGGLALELDVSAGLFGTPEMKEGVSAFFAKRPPQFRPNPAGGDPTKG